MSVVYKKLEEVCEILDSQRIPITAKDRKVGQYPYYGANGLQDYVAEYIFDDELVLLAEDGGNFGSTDRPIAYRVSGKCWVNNHAHVLKAKPCIDIDYLGYSLMFYDTSGLVNGATRQKLTQAAMREMKIPYRNSDEQKEIVRKIDGVFSLIEKSHLELHHLDQLVKSRFMEMFGENVPTVRLGSVCQMINGDRGKNYPSGEDFVPMGVPFVNAGHLHEGRVDFSSMNYITEEKYALLSQGKMRKNDILYCLRGSLGKHGLVDFERGAVASSLVILRCNEQRILPQFLFYAIETPEIEKQLKAANNGSSQPNLSAASVKAYNIKLPSINKQTEFAAFVAEVDKSKFSIQKSLSTSRKLWTLARIDAIMNMDFSTQRSL